MSEDGDFTDRWFSRSPNSPQMKPKKVIVYTSLVGRTITFFYPDAL
jgi:hypothetical protein